MRCVLNTDYYSVCVTRKIDRLNNKVNYKVNEYVMGHPSISSLTNVLMALMFAFSLTLIIYFAAGNLEMEQITEKVISLSTFVLQITIPFFGLTLIFFSISNKQYFRYVEMRNMTFVNIILIMICIFFVTTTYMLQDALLGFISLFFDLFTIFSIIITAVLFISIHSGHDEEVNEEIKRKYIESTDEEDE